MSGPTGGSSWRTPSTSDTGLPGCGARPTTRSSRRSSTLSARVFPAAVVQWEDFKQHNAVRVLERYRHRLPSFNDDIQGTGAVVLAGLLAARRERGGLTSDRFLFVGAGAAAIGIATTVQRELVAEGMDPRAAASAIVMLDTHGLVHTARPALPDDQRPFATDPAALLQAGLEPSQLADPVAVASATGATVLIGATACAGSFSEGLVRQVALHDEAPIVLPLSNPGACAEAQPEDILAWTEGRALVAAGGPGREVNGPAGARVIGQANNVFIFPGLGLGAIVAETREVTDDMFLVAAHELASLVSADRRRTGALYPPDRGAAGRRPGHRDRRRSARLEMAAKGATYRTRRSRRRSIARCGGPTTCRSSPATDSSDRPWRTSVPSEAREVTLIALRPASPAAQTRSKAIATDPPPPRHRVARP